MPVQHVVIVADGRIDDSALRAAVEPGDLVIGADGGARRAMLAGVHVDLVVGDLDSLEAADLDDLVAAGATVIRARPDKDESDTELCFLAALERGATRIRLLGALGGPRIDHELANVSLLAHPRMDGIDVAILDGVATIRRMGTPDGPGSVALDGAADDIVTLLAIDDPVDDVTTHHLRYPLDAEALTPGPARGLSNVMLEDAARIETRKGRLLVIHTRHSTPEGMP
jgi:thiamine pyrophosphokinase